MESYIYKKEIVQTLIKAGRAKDLLHLDDVKEKENRAELEGFDAEQKDSSEDEETKIRIEQDVEIKDESEVKRRKNASL